MSMLTCNACNKGFDDDSEQKLHYRSEWHRYNLKRKVAGVPGVTEELFQARQTALDKERSKMTAPALVYGCVLCGKEYRSSKAHAQHLKSRTHLMKASQESSSSNAEITTVKPLLEQASNRKVLQKQPASNESEDETDNSEDEWVEMDPDEEMDIVSESMHNVHAHETDVEMEELDPSQCFICDRMHDNIESCMVHMHKQHGFFIPDTEYLKDPEGLLIYVGLKVKRDYMCLYCNDRCHPFQSLEAVRKHMIAKAHCKLRYGDGGEDEDVDLEEFYDYSSSYVEAGSRQLVVADDMVNNIELGSGGAELMITRKSEDGVVVRTLGSREFLRYYRQKPRPSPAANMAVAVSLASRYRNMGLATVQSKEQIVKMKILRAMNRSGVEVMRSKIGMKSNVIRNLPKNVPY